MTVDGTGRIEVVDGRQEIVVTRTFTASIEDVWASCTEPGRLDRWIGTWSGDPGPGRTVDWLMTAEEDASPGTITILECEPPRRFLGDFDEDAVGVWRLGFTLSEQDGRTQLDFRMVVVDGVDVSEVGPGWEYYLDRLGATLAGEPFADFDDYYPHQGDYWRAQV